MSKWTVESHTQDIVFVNNLGAATQWWIQDLPWGGVDLVGGADSRGGYVSKILYVEMKESGPLEGACAGDAP